MSGELVLVTGGSGFVGAHCILVGIGPEVAQALVASGANLTHLTTRSDLRSAVAYAVHGNRLTSVMG
jgi:NAD(P)-dependent dehydrogenase (short-subunit alcohol dehydrogenase family)